jgi:cytochrome c6
MVLGLTGREQVLVVVAAAFILFALAASMLVPRFRPAFPGNRLGLFVVATLVMFAAMMAAVVVATGGGHHEEAAVEETEPGETETEPGETETEPGETETEPGETETEPGETETETSETQTGTGETEPGGEQPAGDATAGEEVFASAGCATCHTLSAAGASGTVGPNLDEAQPSAELVVDRVTNGAGVMPPFADQLSEKQIQDVAAYVVESTSG